MTIGFVPAAPLLVPMIGGGSALIDESLREACRIVARAVVAADPHRVTVVAPTASPVQLDGKSDWDFSGFGIPRRLPAEASALPWPLGVGAWLLDEVGWNGARQYVGIADKDANSAALDGSTSVLAVGDGTARRTEKAPGHLDERAADLDAAVAAALRDGDPARLGAIDPMLARELMCSGAPVWRAVAALVQGRDVVRARLLAETAEYGVGYFAAVWELG